MALNSNIPDKENLINKHIFEDDTTLKTFV